jgi:hypothetical protein
MPGFSVGTYSSPHKSKDVEIGCYRDIGNQAMPFWVFGNTYSTFEQCREASIKKRYAYFAIQFAQADYRGICYASNNLADAQRFGPYNNYIRHPTTNKGLGLNDANFIYKLV